MIVKIEIENYQSHKKTVVELVPGTNVIIGKSDAGKSALFRAINWAVSNRPLGDVFRSEWGGDTKVTLHTSEGNVIERLRTASKNEYALNGRTLTAFGTEVPEEIAEVLRMDAANIQGQDDPPFLFSASPGEAARMLNKAASLDDIDRTISGLRKAHSKIEGKTKYSKSQLKNLTEEMEKYADLPIIESKMADVEELEKTRGNKEKEKTALQQIIAQIREINQQLKKTEKVPEVLKKCDRIEEAVSKYRDKENTCKSIELIIHRLKEVKEFLESKKIRNTERADKTLRKAVTLLSEITEKNERGRTLARAVTNIKKSILTMTRAEAKIKRLQSEYDSLSEGMEICPLCGSDLDSVGRKGRNNNARVS